MALRVQFGFLNRFVQQVRSGVQRLDGRIRQRSAMYVKSAVLVYEQTRQDVKRQEGYTEMRRVLGSVERHCPDCPRLADLGWRPLGELPLPGQSTRCGANCACRTDYR